MLRIPCELQPFILDAVCPVVRRLLNREDQFAAGVVPETDDVGVLLVVLTHVPGSGVVLIDGDRFELVS